MENLPRLDQFADFDLQGFDDVEELNRVGCEAFVAAHTEFRKSDFNSLALMKFCNDRNVPFTLRNLEIALRAQLEAGLIEKHPSAPRPAPQKIVTTVVEGRSATAEPTQEEMAFLDKVADNPKLSDHQRKARDEKLRRAAVASRVAKSSLRPGQDPQISI
jgi:hypothetical protein